MKTPNDSSKASLSPPVGGRLRSFRKDWQTNPVILFKSKSGQIPSDSVRIQGPSKDQALATCIQSLLSKNTIERLENVKSLGF